MSSDRKPISGSAATTAHAAIVSARQLRGSGGVSETPPPPCTAVVAIARIYLLHWRPMQAALICERDYQPGFTGWGSFAERRGS
jgi:hypothetical protein